jgi:DNA-binding NarL/FixJ family response regulator
LAALVGEPALYIYGVTMSDASPSGHERAVIYLMGRSALDRLAYKALLREVMQRDVDVDSDFRPISVWEAVRTKPDLTLVDADVAHPDITDAVQMVHRLRPTNRILVLSTAVDPAQVAAWGQCHLHGYVVKDTGVSELQQAVVSLLGGREFFSPGIRAALARRRSSDGGLARLSRRESELLPLLARGLTLRAAAAAMTISYKTADTYRTSLLRKLGVHDRVELARFAIRARIIDP